MNSTPAIATHSARCARRIIRALAVLCLACLPVSAQNDNSLTPAPPREVRRITSENRVEPAPMPPEQIVQAFLARAAECLRAHERYGFKRSMRLQEFLPGGDAGGEIIQESVVYLADNGRRYEKMGETSRKSFVAAHVAAEELKTATQIPLFPLLPDQAQYYNFTYKGSQPLDELHTYIFEVKPKRLLAGYRLFQGLVYVDDHDLAIVQMYGRWAALPENEDAGPDARRTPFTMYEIYFENVEGNLWFPTYIRSDAWLQTKGGEDQLRLIVKMTDFKVGPPAASPPSGSAPPDPGRPAAPGNQPGVPAPPKPGSGQPQKPPAG